MKTFIIGGTGFLGYYTVRELLRKGHQVSTVSLPPMPAPELLPEGVGITLADLNHLSDDEILGLMAGHDGFIFAAGADDRSIPKRPAYPFFYQANVETTRRLLRLAKQAGIARTVIFSSYFALYDKLHPEWHLAEDHPYIRSRRDQITAAMETAGDGLTVSFLMLPYIFGSMPGRVPLWKPLIKYLNSAGSITFYPHGGTAMCAVEEVASAAVAALERGRHGAEYGICTENLTWDAWLESLLGYLGKKKRILHVPNWMVSVGGWFVDTFLHLKGKQAGLTMARFAKFQCSNTFLDGEATRQELGYPQGDLQPAFRDAVQASLKDL